MSGERKKGEWKSDALVRHAVVRGHTHHTNIRTNVRVRAHTRMHAYAYTDTYAYSYECTNSQGHVQGGIKIMRTVNKFIHDYLQQLLSTYWVVRT